MQKPCCWRSGTWTGGDREHPDGIASGCSCVDVSCTPHLSSHLDTNSGVDRNGRDVDRSHLRMTPCSARCCIKLHVLQWYPASGESIDTYPFNAHATYSWYSVPSSTQELPLHITIMFLRHSCTINTQISTSAHLPLLPVSQIIASIEKTTHLLFKKVGFIWARDATNDISRSHLAEAGRTGEANEATCSLVPGFDRR
jgi:hypothetical protein